MLVEVMPPNSELGASSRGGVVTNDACQRSASAGGEMALPLPQWRDGKSAPWGVLTAALTVGVVRVAHHGSWWRFSSLEPEILYEPTPPT